MSFACEWVTMNWNRNHYMTVGFLMIFSGFHFRVVESFVLTPEATKFLNEQHDGLELTGSVIDQAGSRPLANNGSFLSQNQFASQSGSPTWNTAGYVRPTTEKIGEQKVVTPPNWMGWPMIYVGAILTLFGLTMQKTS
jgi:hypothetical protein